MPKISQLPSASAIANADLFAIVQTATDTTEKATASLVLSYIAATIQLDESRINNLTTDLAARLIKADNLSDLPSIPTARGNLGFEAVVSHTIPVAQVGNPYTFLGPLTNGQLLIGSTGLDPVAANITAGTNINISNTPGGITISASGVGSFSWSEVTAASATMTTNSGYITNRGSLVTLTLPTTSSVGDELAVCGKGSGGWLIAQAAGQIIHFGSTSTTSGATGSLASTGQYDSLHFVCTVANTTWTVLGAPQSAGLTVV